MKLFELLKLHDPALVPSATVVHLATHNGHDEPLDVLRRGKFEEWQRWQSSRLFKRPFILGLVKIPDRADRWLFAGCYNSHGASPHPKHPETWLYTTSEVSATSSLGRRVIVGHRRSGRRSTRRGEAIVDELVVIAIREKPATVATFRTYAEVRLSKSELDEIVSLDEPSWRAALAAVAGVYVITDTSNGKLYVGSATGDTSAAGGGGLWSRWCSYAASGHGGNDDLRALLSPEGQGPAHAQHFQFSILEIADTHASAEDVKRRERHWKRVLGSHVHGYNKNL